MSDCSTNDSYDPETGPDPIQPDPVAGSMQLDTDADGFAETTVMDLNSDGVADAYDVVDPYSGTEVLVLDSDVDGAIDTAIVDQDGDGVFDQGVADTDGDGSIDTTFDPATGEDVDDGAPFDEDSGDEDGGDDDGVHGDPMAEKPYHQAQAGANDCLPTSVAMVLTEATGNTVAAEDVVDLANELALLGPDGMTLEGGLALLDHYGVDAEVQTGNVEDLRAMLDAGKPVIIGLDSDDLYGAGDQPFSDDLVAGHAVVITGIDDEAGLIYINDPGFPDGAGVAISIDDFEDAWKDADNTMIVAETTDSTETPEDATAKDKPVEDPTAEDGDTMGRIFDLVLLPFNLKV